MGEISLRQMDRNKRKNHASSYILVIALQLDRQLWNLFQYYIQCLVCG